MLVLFRALVYGTAFIGLLFLYLPMRLLRWSGIGQPTSMGWLQIAGLVIGSAGAAIMLTCVGLFVWIGKGTPAPFDPPRHLVVRGPYRIVQNPMYIGAGLAFAGVAIFNRSAWVAIYGMALLTIAHLLVIFLEEPALRRSFGAEYEAYCRQVRRWLPKIAR